MPNRVRAAVPNVAAKLDGAFYHEACVRQGESPQFLMFDMHDAGCADEIEVRFDARSRPAYEGRGRRYDDE